MTDFSTVIPRAGTASLKYDGRQEIFGSPDVIPLWVADMDFATPPAVTEALIARAVHPVYGYTLYPDSLFTALVSWLKQHHHWEIQREWIMMCPGVVPCLHAAAMTFAAPGEAIIVQPPVYFPFFSAVTATGRQPVYNPLVLADGHYTIDFDHLEHCAASARLLFLCSPHNPVGRVWRKTELQRLLDIANRHHLVIFADEIHADLVYPEHKHHTLAALTDYPGSVITAVAPSKTFNIPGLNLSALIVPDPAHRAALSKTFGIMHINAANPFSIAAFEAAYRGGRPWLDELLVYLRDTRDEVIRYLTDELPEIRPVSPEGTYLMWLDCRATGMNDAQLKTFFVHKAGTGMSPGTLFGEGGQGFMRMNLGAPRAIISTALEKIWQAYRNR